MSRPATDAAILTSAIRTVATVVAVVATLGAAARPHQNRATLQNAPKSVAEPFEWSGSRRLLWSDFLGKPHMASDAAALTVYMLSVNYGCDGDVFSFRVVSLFQPQRSWVRPALLFRASESDRVLHHERSHFDVSEVSARKLRRALGQLADPCKMPTADLDRLASRHVIEDAETQQRYDRETVYGAHFARQLQWDQDISRQLEALAAYVH